jgi:Zn-dependent alcohol dehydrogenase
VAGSRRMRAAVLWEAGGPLSVEEVELLPPGDGEVEVAVTCAGVCGSDIHQLVGEYRLPVPCVPGHEGAGVVERVGPGVAHLAPGDPVVLLWRSPCGRCEFCLAGRPALCAEAAALRERGVLAGGGTRLRARGREVHHFLGVSCWAEFVVVPESAVVRIPAGVPPEQAALAGCAVVTGVGAAWNAAAVRPGEPVAVFGCGGVGLNILQGCAVAGAHPVVAVDARPEKEDLARTFGATHFVPGGPGAPAQVVSLTGGGAAAAFEAVGLPELVEAALAATRRGGRTVLVGVAPAGASARFEPQALVQQERAIVGCLYGSCRPAQEIPRLLALAAAGRLRLAELVSRRYGLGEIGRAVADMRGGLAARVVVDPRR